MGPRDEVFFRELLRDFPNVRIVQKEGDLASRLVDVLLRVVTLNGQRTYLTEYTTVFGETIYVPARWSSRSPEERYITLRHEAIHLRQARRLGRLRMTILYACWPLPAGLAYGRAKIEWEAYEETLRAMAEVYGRETVRSPRVREHILRQFTSAAYGWMFPFKSVVQRWYDAAIERLERDGVGQPRL